MFLRNVPCIRRKRLIIKIMLPHFQETFSNSYNSNLNKNVGGGCKYLLYCQVWQIFIPSRFFFLLASEIQICLQKIEMIGEKIKEFYLREY